VRAVILVGGEGTRLRPLTEWLPKPMLPVANRPFLEHQLAHLAAHGAADVVLACGYMPNPIRAHFGERLSYAVEPRPLGTGGAIAFAAGAGSGTFVAANGDILTDLDLTAMIAFHRRSGARATIALHHVEDASRYGLVRTAEDGEVRAFVEKPPPGEVDGGTINAGTYVLEPDVLAGVPEGRAVSIERDVFPGLVDRGLFAFLWHGRWRDIGTPESYLDANLESMPAGGLVDPGARLDEGADVVESVVGPGAAVEAARVRRSLLLPGARVEHGARLERCIVGPRGVVDAGARLEGEIVW
jgi:mannose-1-phosphate guanylyltransferase